MSDPDELKVRLGYKAAKCVSSRFEEAGIARRFRDMFQMEQIGAGQIGAKADARVFHLARFPLYGSPSYGRVRRSGADL
jgi:hypothetical protein